MKWDSVMKETILSIISVNVSVVKLKIVKEHMPARLGMGGGTPAGATGRIFGANKFNMNGKIFDNQAL